MKKLFLSIISSVLVMTTLSSCLGEPAEYEYYDDAAVTSFTLGTLNRYFHTTSSTGADSIYKKTLNCSGYKFYIDQAQAKIWNTDSLPANTDVSKVLVTINTKNGSNAFIVYKNVKGEDSLAVVNGKDSLDFTQPKVVRIINNSATAYRDYTVNVNVHKMDPDSCAWTKLASQTAFASLSDMRGLCKDGMVFLFANSNGNAKLYTTSVNDGVNWEEVVTSPLLSHEASKSVVLKNNKFFTVSAGNILSSENGTDWNTVATAPVKQIIAASTYRLYGLNADGKLMSSDNDGISWMADNLGNDAEMFPTESISYVCRPLSTNADMEKIVLIGNRSLSIYPNDATAKVWSKIDGKMPHGNEWMYCEFTNENTFMAPRARNWQIVQYEGNSIKGICGKAEGSSASQAFEKIYNSHDDGITWMKDSVLYLPEGFASSDSEFTFFADENNYLWIVCGESGQVWKGCINKVAWKKDQDYFDK